jgi:uncharacterized membrane protein YciS (DUF1049 family)
VWVIKGLLFLSLLFILVYFFVTNADQTVDLDVFGQSYLGVSIYWLVVVCFLAGFATSFVLAALREFKTHRELARLRRQLTDRDREIGELRTLPLRGDDALPAEPAGEAPRG